MQTTGSRYARIAVAALATGFTAGVAQAATVNWIAGTGFWDVAGNWDSGLPGAADDAVINVAGIHTITFRAPNLFSINSFSLLGDETFAMNGGSLTVANTYTNAALTTMTSGTLTLNGLSSMASLNQTFGQISGTGNLTVGGTLTIANGGHSGAATTFAQAATAITGTGLNLDGGRVFQNTGTVTQTNANVNLNSRNAGAAEAGNGTVVNAVGGTWISNATATSSNFILASNQGAGDTGAGAVFSNLGNFVKQGGAITEIRTHFVNDGGIDVQAGTLEFANGGRLTHNGTISVAAGAVLDFGSASSVTHSINTAATSIAGTLRISNDNLLNFAAPHTITGSGTFQQQFGQVTGANLTLGPTLAFNISDGGHSGAATTTVQGVGSISGTGMRLDGGRILRNEGTITQTNANIDMNSRRAGLAEAGNGTVVNAVGGTWISNATATSSNFILASNQGAGDTGAGAVFSNLGNFVKQGGAITEIRTTFDNQGTVKVDSGTLSVTSAFTNAGQIQVAAGATFNGSNAVFVNEGTLAGRGSYSTHVNDDIVNRGAITPGTAGTTGLLSFVGDLDLDEATPGTLNFDLASLSDFDVMAVSDDVTLGGGIVVSNAGYNAVAGDRFVVLTFDQRLGGSTFAGLTTQGFGAGVTFNVIYNLHDVTLEVAAVPEPETWGMLLAGLGMVGYAVRRRRQRMA